MCIQRLLLLIGLCLGAGLSIGPAPERVGAAEAEGQCTGITGWVVTYVEPYRGHLLRIIVRDPMYSEQFPRVGYWITFPDDWVRAPRDQHPTIRGCQETPGGAFTVEIQTEQGDWVSGSTLVVKKLSTDWRRISFTILTDPDDPSSAVIERVIEVPK